MARNLTTTDQPATDQQPAPTQQHPTEGGSYRRDKQTGDLALVEQTKPAAPAEKE